MRKFAPLLLSLLLVGCPQGSKTTSPAPAPSKSASVSAASPASKTVEEASPTAKLPQVTYYAFKG